MSLCLQRADEFMVETQSRIVYSTDAESAAKCSDLVVEAIVENVGIKQELFSRLDSACPR